MIELNKKTQQDFLNRDWVQRLLDAGVDMSDAKYIILSVGGNDKIALADIVTEEEKNKYRIVPTYSTAELLYKLHEWIYPTIDNEEFSGGLRFIKDAPFYMFYYDLRNSEETKKIEDYIFAEDEYPIESLASLLLQCQKKDIGIKCKNINISDK